ncbi:MAG: branched-chain amino acid ABC transporter permease [Bacillota bacterium]
MALFSWLIKYLSKEVFPLPTRMFAFVCLVFLLFLPLLTRDPYLLRILILANIFAVFAASWDLLSGYVGQINLGHALFFGVSAYASAILNLKLGWPPLLTVPAGALLAVLAGLVVGVPALRLKGPYLALATLALPVILMGVVFMFPGLTGGELGISGVARLAKTRVAEYYFTYFLMVALIAIIWKITDSRVGLIFHAIREDEIAVRASGINTTFYKLLAFCLSGLFAGLAGGLYAHFMRIAGPATLEMVTSFQAVIWTIFGGIATVYGPVVGVFILVPVMELLRLVPEVRMLAFALILILVLRFLPEGIASWVQDRLEKECPRCKARNAFTRRQCRVCFAPLENG